MEWAQILNALMVFDFIETEFQRRCIRIPNPIHRSQKLILSIETSSSISVVHLKVTYQSWCQMKI